jgi:hypothetical protein
MSKTIEELAKEYVIEKYFKYVKRQEDDNYELLIEDFISGYQAAAPQWISVKDRLPEINNRMSEDVLMLDEYGQMSVKSFEIVNNEIVVDWGEAGTRPLSDFTHWMPLAQPPEEK